MAHLEDEMTSFYSLVNNKNYIIQPYITPRLIGTGLGTLNSVSDTVNFQYPGFANRLLAYLHVDGSVSAGQFRIECSPIVNPTTWALVGSATSLSAASSNSCVVLFNDVGPFHFIRIRCSTAITGTGRVNVYLSAAR